MALWAASSCNQITGAADIEIEGSGACVPNEQRDCTGSGNCTGTQRCYVDGSGFTACNCGGGSAGSGNGGSGNPDYECIPLTTRACTVASQPDCAGTQTCRLDGSGYGTCECDVTSGQGGAGGSGSGTGGSGVISPNCGVDGAPCSVASDCCGGSTGPGVCGINGFCGTACLPNAACPGCCAALFEQGTNAFLYRVCAAADQCTGISETSPIGVACGNDSQCVGGNALEAACVDDYGFCSRPCLSSLECGPNASCATDPSSKIAICLPVCLTNADCTPFGLSCLSVPTIEGGTALMCAEA